MNKNNNETTTRTASAITQPHRPWPENCSWPDPREQKYGLKIKASVPSPIKEIEKIIGIYVSNDHLLRQAFTRRAFGLDYGLADSEVLEFIGDIILNAVVTQEMMKKFAKVDGHSTIAAFVTAPINSVNTTACEQHETEGNVSDRTAKKDRGSRTLDEGDFTKIRNLFISKEYLSSQASSLGLDRFILYGSIQCRQNK